jgi:hypothetical protein
MANITPYLLVAWVLVVLGLFPALHRRRAVLATFLLGLLFLPEVGSMGAASRGIAPISAGPLHLTKDNAISYAALLAVLLYDWKRLLAGRPRWFDVPMVVWCACPLVSAFTNDPPPDGSWAVRDGLSQALQQTVTWGIPYLLGRLYVRDYRSYQDVALGIVLAAVMYAPLCLVEVRFSPHLHNLAFGFSQHEFLQTIRFGGYRPMVFCKHGLTLALWMVVATLLGAWLCWGRPTDSDPSAPETDGTSRLRALLSWGVFLLLPTVVLLKSTGALALGVLGAAALWLGRAFPSRAWLLVLVAVPPLYVTARTSGAWTGEGLVELVKNNLGEDRAQSLEFRLRNEDRLIQRALERPLFGWGGWHRARVFDEEGNDTTVTDGLWILALGDRGITGLLALGAVLLLPALRFACLFPPRTWSRRLPGPVTVCAVVLVLFAIDSLLNAGFTHLYPFLAGAVVGVNPKFFREAPPVVRPQRTRRLVWGAPVRAPGRQKVIAVEGK